MSLLLPTYHRLSDQSWKTVFAQIRTCHRAVEHAMAWPTALGRRTISQTLCVAGRSDQDWSADYKLFSRSPLSPVSRIPFPGLPQPGAEDWRPNCHSRSP